MTQTLYASFTDSALAEKAAGALLDYGVLKDDISLIAHENHPVDTRAGSNSTMNTGTWTGEPETAVTGGTIGRSASAAWPGSGIGEQRTQNYGSGIPSTGAASEYGVYPTDRSDLDNMADDEDSVASSDKTDVSAKHGISTTTPGDAGAGAAKGAGIGLGVGVIAGLASLLVPGVGLIVGGGALAAAVGAAAATTAAGAVAGGVTGYLKDQGVPDDVVSRYDGNVQNGGALLSVHVPSGDVDRGSAENVLSKYGANDINFY